MDAAVHSNLWLARRGRHLRHRDPRAAAVCALCVSPLAFLFLDLGCAGSNRLGHYYIYKFVRTPRHPFYNVVCR